MKRGRPITHGLSKRPLYEIWRQMIDRCSRPKSPKWARYGGRGIRVCERWTDCLSFEADMLPSYRPGLEIERMNNDGHYCPDNCRWATHQEQMQNTSRTVFIDTLFGRISVSETARSYGISVATLQRRMRGGLTGEALLAPTKK